MQQVRVFSLSLFKQTLFLCTICLNIHPPLEVLSLSLHMIYQSLSLLIVDNLFSVCRKFTTSSWSVSAISRTEEKYRWIIRTPFKGSCTEEVSFNWIAIFILYRTILNLPFSCPSFLLYLCIVEWKILPPILQPKWRGIVSSKQMRSNYN